ncbi:MAG: tetratricopeptide repeat protein [Candidatus Hydrogenedentes bacterium]|nr:tetratricopeptide repeat protein [Candidatus Hydrogenedentota bacterium]
MKTELTESQFRAMVVAVVCLGAVLAYWTSFSGEFVWDDYSSVLLHQHVKDPGKILQLFQEDLHAFGRGQGNFYRPLVAISFMLDYLLSGSQGAGYGGGTPEIGTLVFHLTNTAWHIAAALLLFALLTRLDAPRFVRGAVPLLYVVHPLHTEAITYISGRADPMSAAFMFAALWFALREGSVPKRAAGIVLSAACFAAGLLCKESAFILPALLLLFIIVVPSREGEEHGAAYKRPLVSFAVACALLAAYGALRATVLNFGSDTMPRDITFLGRMIEVGQAFAAYIRLLFVPTGLHMERTLDSTPAWTAAVGALLLVGCVAVAVWAFSSGRRRIALGMGWFLVCWFPVSGIFPLNAPMAEHWMYVPMAGFLWALMELAYLAVSASVAARRAAVAAAYAVATLFIAMTMARNYDWHDNESLYRATLERNPRSTRLHYNLAVVYEDLIGNLPGARRHYEQVLELYQQRKAEAPDEAGKTAFYQDEQESHLSLGRIYFSQQNYELAALHFGTLLRLQTNDSNRELQGEAALGLGQCYLAVGQVAQARKTFDGAAKLIPGIEPTIEALLRQAGVPAR